METSEAALQEWRQKLMDFRLPRWEELPELELYMDQVITLTSRYLGVLVEGDKHALLTSAMVNNYVKQKVIPGPVKKRYNRRHLAYLIVITLLKQVLTIPEVRQGIENQIAMKESSEIYDQFCAAQEAALQNAAGLLDAKAEQVPLMQTGDLTSLALRSATSSLAMKMVAEKMIESQGPA